jgi:uncharacterized membrane protein
MSMKAQSAMEYLMTYGWAILIVIIVAAALYALGIFNPATYTGRIPTGFTTLGTPTDWDLESNGNFSIILKNQISDTVTVYTVTATMASNTDTWDTFNYSGDDTYLQISPGSTYSALPAVTGLDLGSPTAGTSYSVDVSILYNTGSGLNHTETGTVTGTVT